MMKWLIGTLLLLPGAVWAQTPAATKPAENWQTTFFEAPSVALPQLMAAAIRHSAAIKTLDIEQSINKEDLKIVQKNLLNTIALGGSYTYGNLSSIAVADPNATTTNTNGLSTYSSSRYFAGVNVAVPLDRLASRKNNLHRERLNLERTQSVQKEREDVVRQQVIQLYQNVLLARKLLTLRQESYVNAQSTYRLAEKQFRQGQLTLTEFNEASGQLTDVNIAQESARNQYDTAFMLLEEFTGDKISAIIK